MGEEGKSTKRGEGRQQGGRGRPAGQQRLLRQHGGDCRTATSAEATKEAIVGQQRLLSFSAPLVCARRLLCALVRQYVCVCVRARARVCECVFVRVCARACP